MFGTGFTSHHSRAVQDLDVEWPLPRFYALRELHDTEPYTQFLLTVPWQFFRRHNERTIYIASLSYFTQHSHHVAGAKKSNHIAVPITPQASFATDLNNFFYFDHFHLRHIPAPP